MSDKSAGKEPPKKPGKGKSQSQKRQKVARNFIKTYGRSRFRELLSSLAEGKSGQLIANDFGVSRERVRQWKNAFGQVITIYQVYPEIQKVLDEELGPVYEI